jgi:hypothetical protein
MESATLDSGHRRLEDMLPQSSALGTVATLKTRRPAMKKGIFWIFGILQSLSLGMIIFLVFRSMNLIKGECVIGLDTQILLSIAFPLFLLIVEYIIFSKEK